MAPNPSNSSILKQPTLKGLIATEPLRFQRGQNKMYVYDRMYRRANPLYDITSFTVKSRDSNHVTPTSACPPRCLLILVAISIVLATAAVVMATLAIAVSFAGECRSLSVVGRRVIMYSAVSVCLCVYSIL